MTKIKTRRELLIDSANALDFYAGATDKPRTHRAAIPPPKRHKIKRIDGRTTLTEYQEQGLVIEWWWHAHATYGLPVFALFSIPNGAYLASGYMGAAMLKKAGMRPGAPDLMLAARPRRHVPYVDYCGLFIEMKREQGGRQSPEQAQFGHYLQDAGYLCIVAHGAEQATAAIKEYLA
jgi:hypothetical protein